MKWRLSFLLLLASLLSSLAQDLKPIFNGKTLAGWNKVGDAVWEINKGEITGKTGGGGFGWLCTTKPYGDFILELEVKIDAGNSGVQVRSHLEGDKMVGYQIEVDSSPRAWSGGLYEQGRRGWLNNLSNNAPARVAFNTNDWNKYRIECRGDSIKSWVNGVPAADYIDSMDVEGIIALQVHSGKDCRVHFRNIRLADLGKHRWQPLWDGKTMKGWHATGKGEWKIQDGTILTTHDKAEKEFGHLISDRRFQDFTVRLKYKAVKGNSGLYFRVDEGGRTGVAGFQAEIDAEQDAGGLYETDGRAWVVKPSAEDVKKWFKPQEWNTMTVSAHGSRIAVDVNGLRTAELLNDPGRREGHLALQTHGSRDCELYFKDIEILEPTSKSRGNTVVPVGTTVPGKPAKAPVKIKEDGNKLRVEIGGKLFTEYHYQDVPRPFCYPLMGPNDTPMTRNYPMKDVEGEERDHPHHRGLWFTHGDVNGFDFWSEQKAFGKIVHEKFTAKKSGNDYGLIKSENRWVSPHGKVVCRDERVLKIYGQENPKILDFEVTIKAGESEVILGDTKEGSMAIRVAESMRLKPNEAHKDKPTGHIVQNTGTRDADTWGKRAAWCDSFGAVNGKTVGVAIMDHPQNPRHPTWWHVRDYGLFAANPFGVHDFEKKAKGEGNLRIEPGKQVTFRYRFVFHEGDEKQAGIADLFSKYSAEKFPTSK